MALPRDGIVVLHVDDDPDTSELVSSYFEHHSGPISVASASDGADALDRLDADVDCIVSDYHMPGMDGIELLAEVREGHPDLPFILLTGMGSEEVASEAISAGATEYFQKSTMLGGLETLAQHIENIVARCRAQVSYQELFENAVEGFSLHDPETGAFIDANASVCRILRYETAELLEMTIGDIRTVPPQADRDQSLLASLRRTEGEESIALEEFCRRRDGTPFWLKIQFKQVEVNGRTLVLSQMRDITERKRYEETLSALHTSMADLVGAERASQVSDCVRTAVLDLLNAEHAAVFLHDSVANELSRARGTATASTEPTVMDVPVSSDSPIASAFIEGETMETTDMSVFEPSSTRSQAGCSLFVPFGEHGVLVIGTEETAFDDDMREFVEILAGAAMVALDRIQKDHEIHSNREELRSRGDEMERLTQTNDTLHELSTVLRQVDTSEEACDAACAALSMSEPATLVWVGRHGDDGTFGAAAWSGTVPEYLDDVALDGQSTEPATIAAGTGAAVRVDNTALHIQKEPWRRTALAHGVESVLAVPIQAEGVTYGVLSVLGDEQSAFDDRFHEMVSTVATWLGEALSSLEQRQRVLAPAAATVTFELDAGDHFLGRLASETGGCIELRGVVTDAADRHRVYLSIDDADPTQVAALANELAVVRTADVVSDGGDSGTLELQLAAPLLGVQISEQTAAVEELHATGTAVQTTVRIAHANEVRDVAEAVQERYPGATLLSKRQHQDPFSDHRRLLSFRESLTPRQHEVVEMAYLNGYFDSPRCCSGQELGEKLGISSQAVYQHLRAAQRKLLDEAFDGSLGVSLPDE